MRPPSASPSGPTAPWRWRVVDTGGVANPLRWRTGECVGS
jgi:hypothetical protein